MHATVYLDSGNIQILGVVFVFPQAICPKLERNLTVPRDLVAANAILYLMPGRRGMKACQRYE